MRTTIRYSYLGVTYEQTLNTTQTSSAACQLLNQHPQLRGKMHVKSIRSAKAAREIYEQAPGGRQLV
jgi:hypothetical protein